MNYIVGIIRKFTGINRCFKYGILILLGLFFLSVQSQAQSKKTRILFILDASSSMTYEWNADYNRFAIARNILLQIVDSMYTVNNEVEFAVRVYGTDYAAQDKNCTDSRLIVPFNLQNVNQIKRRLKYTDAIGWSPIAFSLQQAAFGEVNNESAYDYSIIFLTDGGESCGGDICKTYKELLEKKVSVTPYIIGLDKNELLKGYYACLGKYVSVLELEDIPKAVKLIVDENKPILNKKQNLNLKTIYSNSPVKRVKEPPKPIVIEKPKPKVDTVATKKVEQPKPAKRITEVFPRLKSLDALRRFVVVGKASANYVPPFFDKINLKIDIEEPKPKVVRNTSVFPAVRPFEARHRFVYAYRAPQPLWIRSFLYDKIEYKFAYTPIKRDTVLTQAPKPQPKKAVSNSTRDKPNTKISREVIPNDITKVQIFFENKFQKKKMYRSATPTILIQDASTGEQVGKFIRKVRGGSPELQDIQPGTYRFVVKGDNRITSPDVRIDPNSINKVTIFVTDGTIEFAYIGNLKRPVEEFQAYINPRFEPGNSIIQECTDKLYYPPATYYIEVNTLPPTKYAMVDLDFGEIRQIQLAEPGFLQINNTNRLGRVELLHPLNDQYVRFHSFIVNGNVIDQKVRLQPGTYRAVFSRNPEVPALGTKEVTFKVSSNEVTQLLLE